MASPIICIKLTSGEELIAKVNNPPNLGSIDVKEAFKEGQKTWEVQGTYLLEDVLSLAIQPTQSHSMALALIPWMVADHEAPVLLDFEKHVVAIVAPRKEIEEAYISQTSKIAIARSGSSVKDLSSALKITK